VWQPVPNPITPLSVSKTNFVFRILFFS